MSAKRLAGNVEHARVRNQVENGRARVHRRILSDRARQRDVERPVAVRPGVVEHVGEALVEGQVGVRRVDHSRGVPAGSQFVQPCRVLAHDGIQIRRNGTKRAVGA